MAMAPAELDETLQRAVPAIRAMAYSMFGRYDDDLVQVGLIALWRFIDAGKATNLDTVVAGARKQIRGAMIDDLRVRTGWRRTSRPDVVPLVVEPIDTAPPVDEQVATRMDAAVAFRSLDERPRMMLTARLEGDTVAALAERHGCTAVRISQIAVVARLMVEHRMLAS